MTPPHHPSPPSAPPGAALADDGRQDRPTSHPVGRLRVVALVPAYDEAESIGATIEAVLAQDRVPDEVVVIPNGCSDGTAEVARRYPVTVLELPRLEHKKSEALNTAWSRHGRDADIVICLDADTVLPPHAVRDWEQEFLRDADLRANRASAEGGGAATGPRRGRGPAQLPLGGSSSKFTMLGGDFLTRLQRAEFSRWTDTALRRGWTSVLAGTGAAISGEALRAVAAREDRDGPWPYTSQVEDFELTYRIRELGYRCQVSPTVRAYTDSMKTVKALWGQRMKWQVGTIEDLLMIGVNRLTLVDWFQQASGLFSAFARFLWLAVLLALCLVGDLNFQWVWWVALPLFFVAVQVRHALRIPHRDRADLVHAFLIVPAETFAWLRAGWFTAAWFQAPLAMLLGKRKDRWQAQYRAEAFRRGLVGRIRLVGARTTALAVAGLTVLLSVGNLYPASGLPTVASMARVGPVESFSRSVPRQCAAHVALTYEGVAVPTADLLRRYGLHATFFLTAEQVEQDRAGVRAIAADGHQIGVRVGVPAESRTPAAAQVAAEIRRASALVEAVTGERPRLVRPADGTSDAATATALARAGLAPVTWTVDADDPTGRGARALDDAISTVRDGDVVRLQGDDESAVRAVPLIAATLRDHDLCTGRVIADPARPTVPAPDQNQRTHVVSW